jgi:DnaK suppressor protein
MANAKNGRVDEAKQRLERRLRQQQKELERALYNSAEEVRTSGGTDSPDVADQAVAGYQKEMLFSQSTATSTQLRLVKQALNRMAEGTYGECVRCDQTIGAKRIEALPWTPYCIDCQEQIEKGEAEPAVA